ncbi:MAG: DUF2490 domain-containing protein [Bacteroides sp.]|jgi:hypothetical protein|nr:DUF2490 domain-containing protein [Bacteroides sp.]
MATYFFKRLIILLFAIMGVSVFSLKAQTPVEFKAEPALSLSWKINDRWGLNGQVKMGQLLNGNTASGFEKSFTERFELQAFANYSLFGSRKISLGYVAGMDDPFLEEPGYEHRITEQFSFVSTAGQIRLAVRLRAEQRFRTSGFQQRYRARISTDIPLRGERLDETEPYLILQNEILASPADGEVPLDNRLDAGIGWLLPGKQKFQVQLQHRFEKMNLPHRGHVIQIVTAYFFNF